MARSLKHSFMRYIYGALLLCSIIFWSSCRNDFETIPSTGNLTFSKDTVYLDTVFTNIGSSTYNLKVYNNSKDDIHIPVLKLAQGENSHYRLNVDGMPGKVFENVQILAKDSIFIFIETTFDINSVPGVDNEFLYTDQILFENGAQQQKVELVTLIRDAVFLYPQLYPDGTKETLILGSGDNTVEIPGFILPDERLTFTNEKPYVIYGFAAVPPNKTLTVNAGARIHFHAESGILVAQNASLKALGQPSVNKELMENEIIFQGDRLEPQFANVPGQWGYIRLTSGSVGNEFHHTTIKNGMLGLVVEDSPVTLKNVQIYNSSNIGLLSRTGIIYGENMVINNSGQASLGLQLGGSYEFNHCTFSNYWSGSFRSFPTVLIENTLETPEAIFVADLVKANFTNCIIYGSDRREIGLYRHEQGSFNFNFTNSLIKFEDPMGEFKDHPLYDFENEAMYSNNLFNSDPKFFNYQKNNFNIIKGESAAEEIGKSGVLPPIDLNGNMRTSPPDAGAYEATVIPD